MNKEEIKARFLCSVANGYYDKVTNTYCLCNEDSHRCNYWRFYLKKFRRTRLQIVKNIFEALFKC